jgi:glycosyltransferase involved in cell wall biosynthesis
MTASAFETRLAAAEQRTERLRDELSGFGADLAGGHFLLPSRGDGDQASDTEDPLASGLWAQIASMRVQVERLSFENRLLWSRASRPADEKPPVALAAEHAEFHERALRELKEGGMDAATRYLEELTPKIGRAAIATLFRLLAEAAIESDPGQALRMAERAQAIRPELATARLIKQAASQTGDIAARARAAAFVLGQGGAYLRAPAHIDQHWSDAGNSAPFLDWTKAAPSGVPYPRPVYGRVLMALYSSLPLHRAGYGYRSQALLKELKGLGCQVRAYTRLGFPRDVRRFANEEPEAGFEAHEEVDGIVYRRLLGSTKLARWGAPLDSYLSNYAEALQLAIRRERAHIVHTASNFINPVAGYLAARDARLPFIHEVRGFWDLTGTSREVDKQVEVRLAQEARLEAEAASRADRVITLNDAMKDELVRRGVDASRIVIAPNAVDPEALSPMARDGKLMAELGFADAPTIGYVGSFAHYEGLDDLVLAFHKLKQRGLRFNGLLVGDGEVYDRLLEMIGELDLAGEVRLTGRVDHDQVQRYYSLVDIAPFPRKPLKVCELVSPMKPYEAMGMAKTVVVSSVQALADMVENGETGIVHEKGDVDSLARQLELLIADRDHCRRVGEAGRQWVLNNRTWKHSARIIADVYREVAAEWAARRVFDAA